MITQMCKDRHILLGKLFPVDERRAEEQLIYRVQFKRCYFFLIIFLRLTYDLEI